MSALDLLAETMQQAVRSASTTLPLVAIDHFVDFTRQSCANVFVLPRTRALLNRGRGRQLILAKRAESGPVRR